MIGIISPEIKLNYSLSCAVRIVCFAPQPDQVWVTVITYIKSPKGRLYLCLANDLFSCPSVGWSAQSCMTTDLILQASHETVLRRKPAS